MIWCSLIELKETGGGGGLYILYMYILMMIFIWPLKHVK